MRKKKRRFHNAEHPNSMPDFFEEDKDQKFYLGRLATYLHRILTIRPILDSEVIDILCQLMPEKTQDLTDQSRRIMRDAAMEDDEEEEYNEAQTGRAEEMVNRLTGLTKLNSGLTAKLVKHVLRLLERKRAELRYPGLSRIEKKMAALSRMFALTRQEQEVCYFLFINSTYQPADHFFVDHLQCHTPLGRKHLSAILDMRAGEIDNALGGTLQRIDMVEMGRVYFQLRESFVDYFIKASGPDLHRNFFTHLAKKTIPLDCHFVDKDEADHVLKLLKDRNETPTHILLYGAAGTGKTSFAKGIARELKIPAYEIAREDDNTSLKRRAAIVACLNMTNKGAGSLIVADEADNLLNTDGAWLRRGETQDKGWLNGLLEVPGVRMIWITNTTDGIEPSVLRRFAYSIPFKPFTRKQRYRLWESVLRQNKVKRHFGPPEISELAGKYNVSAGAMDIAVKNALTVSAPKGPEFKKAVRMALESHLTLLHNGQASVHRDEIEKGYSLEGLNVEGDLPAAIHNLQLFDQHLRQSKDGPIRNLNLLFFGPPGTGKSELARYIATHLGKEILCKRASDIIDCYVGLTEKKIRDAFREAEADEAILLFDEADSMLFSRGRAVRSWEVSFTNEFLVQMERYRGILICTTNRMEDLDPAAIRRFNEKIGFNYLTPDGNVTFYQRLLAHMVHSPMTTEEIDTLRNIKMLTPGDYRVVRDKYAFYAAGSTTHRQLLDAVKMESTSKTLADRKIGQIGY